MDNYKEKISNPVLYRLMYQNFLPDVDYLYVKLIANSEGKIDCYIYTMWVGFTSDSPKCEIREPSSINPQKTKQLLEDRGEAPLIINNLEDLCLFRLLGGHGIIRKDIAFSYWPSIWKVSPSINGGHEPGFVELNSVSNSELAKRPRKPLKTIIKNRDGNKCVLCSICSEEENLTLHHILHREWGGRTTKNNLITLCCICHNKIHENVKTICYEGLYTKISVNKYSRQDSKEFWESVERYGALMCSKLEMLKKSGQPE